MANPALRIASVCRELPNPADPSTGIFVLRRLAAMARHARVETIQPIAYFPWLRPLPKWGASDREAASGMTIHPERMFYVPKVLKSLDGEWLRLAVARALRKLQADGPIDAVDAHFGYPEGVGSFLAARQLGIPVFITLRGFEAEYIHKPLIGPQIAHAIKNADGCICVSHFLAELALAHGAVPDRTTVIHNAVDDEIFHPGDKHESRRRLGLAFDVPLVVTVGHLISRKRHHVLIAAFAKVLQRVPSARLVIIGGESFETRYPETLRARVSALGIDDAVAFAGNIPASDVADWLRAADLFALATQREGCCNAVLEALATGLPVVTTPVGDNAHFVRDGDNGFIVPVDDASALAAAIVRGLEHAWDRHTISRSLSVGSWDRVAGQVLDFFSARLSALAGHEPHARRPVTTQ